MQSKYYIFKHATIYVSRCLASSLLITTALLCSCQVLQGERHLDQYSSDAAITAKVKTALFQSSEVPGSRIHVETDKGIVLLSGFLKTHYQVQQAANIAYSVQGVGGVINHLTAYSDYSHVSHKKR